MTKKKTRIQKRLKLLPILLEELKLNLLNYDEIRNQLMGEKNNKSI